MLSFHKMSPTSPKFPSTSPISDVCPTSSPSPSLVLAKLTPRVKDNTSHASPLYCHPGQSSIAREGPVLARGECHRAEAGRGDPCSHLGEPQPDPHLDQLTSASPGSLLAMTSLCCLLPGKVSLLYRLQSTTPHPLSRWHTVTSFQRAHVGKE